MRRFVAGLLVMLLVVIFPALSFSTSAIGDNALTRLWVYRGDERRFACTGFYITPKINEFGAWLVSAGHCAPANIAGRDNVTVVYSQVDWRIVVKTKYTGKHLDLALGSLVDPRFEKPHYLFLASATPPAGTWVYVHGFPTGVESVVPAQLGPESDLYPGSREIYAAFQAIGPGSSGSPVLTQDGRVVGVIWGGVGLRNPVTGQLELAKREDGRMIGLFTPVEALLELLNLVGGLPS